MKLSMDRFMDEEMRAKSELDRFSTMGFFSANSSASSSAFAMDLLGRCCSGWKRDWTRRMGRVRMGWVRMSCMSRERVNAIGTSLVWTR